MKEDAGGKAGAEAGIPMEVDEIQQVVIAEGADYE